MSYFSLFKFDFSSKVYCFSTEKILKDFAKYRLGSRTGKKDIENARQSFSHGLRFCEYMAAELPTIAISHDLRFINQMDKLRA